jgi:Na+-driven multidrug efflux pump
MEEPDERKTMEDLDSTSEKHDTPGEDIVDFELTGMKLFLVMIGLGLAIFLMSIDTSIIATAIPRITSQFGSTDDIGWYGSAYTFTTCAMQPIAGKLFANFSMKVSKSNIQQA